MVTGLWGSSFPLKGQKNKQMPRNICSKALKDHGFNANRGKKKTKVVEIAFFSNLLLEIKK